MSHYSGWLGPKSRAVAEPKSLVALLADNNLLSQPSWAEVWAVAVLCKNILQDIKSVESLAVAVKI